jgi:hypothetical protein
LRLQEANTKERPDALDAIGSDEGTELGDEVEGDEVPGVALEALEGANGLLEEQVGVWEVLLGFLADSGSGRGRSVAALGRHGGLVGGAVGGSAI